MDVQELTEDEIAAEDEWFAMHWKATGTAIRFALAQARESGPCHLASRVCHPEGAESGGWRGAIESEVGGVVLAERHALPLVKLRVEAPVGPEEDRLERIMRVGQALGHAEQQHFAESIAPSVAHPWISGDRLPFDSLLDPAVIYDALLNEDSTCGRAVSPHSAWLQQRLGGRIVSGNFGADFPLLLIPAGSLEVHFAGGEAYKRPTAGILRIEIVGALERSAGPAIVAIAAEPSPGN